MHGVAFDILHFDAVRVVLPRDMKRPDVQYDDPDDDEGQKVMESEEAVERRVADGIAAP